MSGDGHIYKAMLRPVALWTLPMDIREWRYVHRPESLEGGRYGVIALPRALDEDERSGSGWNLLPPAPGRRTAWTVLRDTYAKELDIERWPYAPTGSSFRPAGSITGR